MNITRSGPPFVPKGRILCGNCRGTGSDGFDIMPDSFPCEACNGKGSVEVDPNAKTYTWSEFMKLTEKKSNE